MHFRLEMNEIAFKRLFFHEAWMNLRDGKELDRAKNYNIKTSTGEAGIEFHIATIKQPHNNTSAHKKAKYYTFES